MLEGPAYLVSRELPSSCEQESKWIYNAFRVIELSNGKRCLEDAEMMRQKKSAKLLDALDREGTMKGIFLLSLSPMDQSGNQNRCGDQSDTTLLMAVKKSTQPLDALNREETMKDLRGLLISPVDQSANQRQNGNKADTSSLITQVGRDLSINCLLHLSRSEYGSIASLNRSFQSLIRSGELYKLRRQMGIVEHWVYFSCNLFEWQAFDPIHHRWMHLPRVNFSDCFMCSDKESLCVGPELLVFGKEIYSHVIYKYSLLTNSWSSGAKTNTPRCLFGSASMGEKAIVAGGCDLSGNILSTAELYNSETGTWQTLPNMNKPRKMSSGVFMDGKFYVLGGVGEGSRMLTCGEMYDLNTRTWHEIPNMFPLEEAVEGTNIGPAASRAPPLLAVVKNELYAGYYDTKLVKKYDKAKNSWMTKGRLPERTSSMNGWGLAFRACGDMLIVLGGPMAMAGGVIELNAWVPDENPPHWTLLATKPSGCFVYNCAVMGC